MGVPPTHATVVVMVRPPSTGGSILDGPCWARVVVVSPGDCSSGSEFVTQFRTRKSIADWLLGSSAMIDNMLLHTVFENYSKILILASEASYEK